MLGIDLSNTTLKIVELYYLNNTYSINSFATFNKELSEANYLSFSNFLKNNFTTLNACVGVPSEDAIIEIIKLPGTYKNKQLNDAVLLEAQNYFSECISTFYYDFQILNNSDDSVTSILFIAVPIKKIYYLLEFLIQAGINLQIVEPGSFAHERVKKYLLTNNFNFLCNSECFFENESYLLASGLAMRVCSL